jgi:FxLD family lantipeptide
MATMTANASPLTAEDPAGDPAVAALLADLDITVVEAGPATASRKCSTDNGCDTVAGSQC